MCRLLSYSWLSLVLLGCAQPISQTGTPQAATVTVDIDPTISEDQYAPALRRVKGLLLDRPFLTPEEQGIRSMSEYQEAVRFYLDDPATPLVIQKLYQQILQVENTEVITTFPAGTTQLSVDNNEPAALAAYLFKNGDDFRKILTADYCVSDFAAGLSQKADCIHQGRIQRNDNNTNDPTRFFSVSLPAQMRAGAISTQGFLKKYAGALNFRRTSKAREFFLCSSYPDPEEDAGWTQQNTQLHPFYWTPMGADQDCQSCHSSLNRVRGFFTGFGALGEIQMGQAVTRISDGTTVNAQSMTINDVERVLIALPDYETLYGKTRNTAFEGIINTYHGESLTPSTLNARYPRLSDYGRILSENQRFPVCTAQRLYNFALGFSQSYLNKLPDRLSESLAKVLIDTNHNLKPLLVEIFSTTDFLNR